MTTQNVDLFSYLPGLETTENELLESELLTQQILKAAYPTLDLREGTALRDLNIRPNATMLALINKALVFFFQNNTLSSVDNSTPQIFVDSLMSNWFLDRKQGEKSVINARLYFAKAKTVNLYADTFFSTDGTLKFYPTASLSYGQAELTFEAASNQYYLDVDLIAEEAGVDYNITTGSLLYFSNFDPFFLHAEINYLRQTAEDIETNDQFVERARTAISTRNLINVPSIDSPLRDYFSMIDEVKTIGYGDPEMVRDQIKILVPGVTDPVWIHNGGCVDVYTRVPVTSSVIQLTTDSQGKVVITGAVYSLERSLISGGLLDDTVPMYVPKAVSSLTRSSTTVTVTSTAHGYTTGDKITILGASPLAYNGEWTVTVTGANTFTYEITGTPTTPATGTITANTPLPFTWTNTDLVTVVPTGITRTGTVATATYENHGLRIGDRITMSGSNQSDYNGVHIVTSIPTRDTFTYEVANSPVTPSTGTLSMKFVNRQMDLGFSDRQSITVDFGIDQASKTASFILYFHENVDGIQGYLNDAGRRVLCGDLVAKGFNLTMLDIIVTAYNGPAPDAELCNTIIIDYLAGVPAGQPFVMSDLLAQLYAQGITTIKTPLDITYKKYWGDLLNVTTGTITDVLDPNDTLNIFKVNSVTTTNQNI